MSEALRTYIRLTSDSFGNVISLPESADGRSPPGLQGGPMIGSCGLDPAPASRSASQALGEAVTTSATYGRTSSDSSKPADRLSGWESRLRQRLANIGSTACSMTWKESATPAGRRLSRLVPSVRHTGVTACGLWQTPVASEARQGFQDRSRGKKGSQESLTTVAVKAMWPTPLTNDALGSGYCYGQKKPDGTRAEFLKLPGAALVASGHPHRGSSATTEKPGALNPTFVCWLMGFPAEWDACAPTAMPSSRRSRRK